MTSRLLTRFHSSLIRKMPLLMAAMFNLYLICHNTQFKSHMNPGNIPSRQMFFHKDWATKKASWVFTSFFLLSSSDLDFDPTWPSFTLLWNIIWTNVLAMFHENWARNVTSTVFTSFFLLWSSDLDFDPTWPSLTLYWDIVGTNVLAMFHEDWTINKVSRVFTTFV